AIAAAVAPAAAPPSALAEPAAASGAQGAVEDGGLDSVCSLWPAVVDVVRAENALLGALIAEARPVELQGLQLTLAFASTFLKKKAEDPANRTMVAEALQAVTGSRFTLGYELREIPAAGQAGGEEGGTESEERWLARFMEEFEAVEVPVEQEDEGEPAVTGNEKGA
ncbi:MAG TPA: hypothetical protein VMD59_17050, partial [Acidimicrobiales bacterium]|nr:hypothetical protein [Acidimicrobiales bacterium]